MAATSAVLEWGGARVDFDSDPAPENGLRLVLVDVTGWYGGVGVRTEKTDRVGHGGWAGRAWRTGRTLTVKAHLEVDDPRQRDAVLRDLSAVLWDGEEGTLTATVDGLTLSCPVKLDGEPGIVPDGIASATVQLPLYSPDPWLYGEDRVLFTRPLETGVGLVFPLFSPAGVLSFGSAIAQDGVVTNLGTAEAYPTHLVVGNFPGGFRLTVDGRTVEWPWPTVREAPVQIESSGSVWIGSANVTAQASLREWSSIAPGHTITPSLAALQGGDGWCETHHRDTYI